MDIRSSADHRSEVIARAQTFVAEVRAAAQAARERIYAGVETPVYEAPPAGSVPEPEHAVSRGEEDPIFATREFDVPAEALRPAHRF